MNYLINQNKNQTPATQKSYQQTAYKKELYLTIDKGGFEGNKYGRDIDFADLNTTFGRTGDRTHKVMLKQKGMYYKQSVLNKIVTE